MDVDIVSFGVFLAIACVIGLTVWTDFRNEAEKRARLERSRHQR